jgi:CubicO group peptidase (beta-lactamase class C family)
MHKKLSQLDRRQFLALAGAIGGTFSLNAAEATNRVSTNKTAAAALAPKNLNDLLEPVRAKGKVPALAAAMILDGKLAGVGAVGIRKGGSPILVKGTDLWHIGSCTKAMTATLIAGFVERKKMQWDMTIGDTLPAAARAGMHSAYRDVTLEQLLTQRSGLPTQADSKLWEAAWAHKGTPMEQRLEFVKGTLAIEPAEEPGKKFIYSNQNYSVAGVMLETVIGQPWESLMRDNLFRALNMTLSGFGVPGTIGQIDQPWGHKWKSNKLEPQQSDNPPAIAPGGAVHCSIYDFVKFAMLHLNGANGEARLIKAETFQKLHTPPAGQDYAMGWSRQDREWAKGYTLNHNGSNTLNYAVMWLAPKIKFAAVAATNIGGDSGEKTCDDAMQALIKKYVTPPA